MATKCSYGSISFRAERLENEPSDGDLSYQPPMGLRFCQQEHGMWLESQVTAIYPVFALALGADANMEAKGF